MRKCYIAGKIGDLPEEEYKRNFDVAKDFVYNLGYEPVSPVDLPHEHERTWQSYMKEDLKAMMDCKAVYALKNWRSSPGATIEIDIAMKLGINIIFQT